MGSESKSVVRIGRVERKATVHLDSETLTISGRPRVIIPLREIEWASDLGGLLTIFHAGRTIEMEIGAAVSKWRDRILNPPSLVKKLGVKPGHQLVVRRLPDKSLLSQLRDAAASVVTRLPTGPVDMILVHITSPAQLGELSGYRDRLAEGGCIWALWPRGGEIIREDMIRKAARPIGLVDVKVAKVSEEISGLKLMRRKPSSAG